MNSNRLLVIMITITVIGTTVLVGLGVLITKQRDKRNVMGVSHANALAVPGTHPAIASNPLETAGLDIELPAFELTDRHGETFSSESLRGKVWVVDFVFTTCPGLCPAMSATMEKLQADLRERTDWDGIRLVSISVDPEQDTPAALRDYASRFHADDTNWIFLTGQRSYIWDLVQTGFLLDVGDNPEYRETGVGMPIIHSPRFGLIDQQGKLRGYFHVLRSNGYHGLLAAIDELMKTDP